MGAKRVSRRKKSEGGGGVGSGLEVFFFLKISRNGVKVG